MADPGVKSVGNGRLSRDRFQDVAYDAGSDTYLVLFWRSFGDSCGLRCQRIDANGDLVGSMYFIATWSLDGDRPRLTDHSDGLGDS